MGYLRSLSDLENVSVSAKNGTPVMLRDIATVSFGPDIREGVAEWQGEGETVGAKFSVTKSVFFSSSASAGPLFLINVGLSTSG